MSNRLYLYGVIKSSSPVTFNDHGIGNDESTVYTVSFRDLSMVVSDSDVSNVDPTRRNVLCHEHILSSIMERFTVIPCAFGTVVKDKKEIKSILELHYEEIKRIFLKIDQKIELGLKVFWKKEFFQYLREEDQEIKNLSLEITQAGQDKSSYDKKIYLGELVEKKVEEKRKFYHEKIFNELSKLAEEAKLNQILGINMAFNAAFLVDKEREEEFDQKVETLYQQYEKDLQFSYSGPWPPHNFVDINLGGES